MDWKAALTLQNLLISECPQVFFFRLAVCVFLVSALLAGFFRSVVCGFFPAAHLYTNYIPLSTLDGLVPRFSLDEGYLG